LSERDRAILPAVDETTNEHDADNAPVETGAPAADMPAAVEVAAVENGSGPVEAPAAPNTEPLAEPTPEPGDAQWAEATGAVVLGVLDPEDAAAAGQAIARSRALQAEVAALLPVADILLSLYQTQPASAPVGEAAPVVERTVSERLAPPAARRVERPLREPTVRPGRLSPGGVAGSAILIGALALVAVLGFLWALALSDRVATREDEIAALKRQVTEFRQSANASAFSLSPASETAENARGTVFYSIADSKVLIDVSGLPELDEDRVYQVWFQRGEGAEWQPGPTFPVNASGEAVQRLPGETPAFVRIAVSEEPAPGSPEPSGPFLLEGALAGANG
jgi:hypothetical protein